MSNASKWRGRLVKSLIALALMASQLLSIAPSGKAEAGAADVATTATVSSPNAKPGDSVTIKAVVASQITRSLHLQLKVVGPSGSIAYETWLYNQPVTAGQTSEFPVQWTIPADLPGGRYTVSIGTFGSNWDTMYDWSSGLAPFSVASDSQTPVFSASVSAPSEAEPGSSVAVVAAMTADRATNARVALKIVDPANGTAFERTFEGVAFAANEPKAFSASWTVPADAAIGTYRVQATVTDAAGTAVYYDNAAAAAVNVEERASDPAEDAVYTTRAVIPNADVKAGDKVPFTVETKADKDVSVLIDVAIADPYSGDTLYQKVLSNQRLTPEGFLSIPLEWTVPAEAANGKYLIQVGIFGNKWEGPYSWNSQAGSIRVSDGTEPPVSFTATASASPASVKTGETVGLTVTATGSVDADALVQVTAIDSKGAVAFSREFANERFSAKVPRSLSAEWKLPADAELGAYKVSTVIYSPDRSEVYYQNDTAAQFTVEKGNPPPEQPDNGANAVWTTSATVEGSVEAGYPVDIAASVSSSDYAHALVDVEVYKGETKIYQRYFDDQYFQPNSPKSYSVTWNVPATQERGVYTVKVGVFPAGWKPVWNSYWNANAATFEVNWGIIPDITEVSSADLDSVVPGQKQTVRTSLTSSETLPAAVRLELLDSAGNRVAERNYPEESFAQGVEKAYELEWTPPANAVNGDYKLRVSVAKPDGVRVFYTNPEAASFELTGGIDLKYTLDASVGQAEVRAGETLNVNAKVGSTAPSVVSMKVSIVDELTGETVHSDWLPGKTVSPGEEASLEIDWELPKWIRMNETKVRAGLEPLERYVLDGDYKVNVELYNADRTYRILAKEGAASFKVTSPVDAPAPQPAVPPTLPDIMKLGVFATNNDEYGVDGWMEDTGLPWNFAYRYLNGGVNNEDGWTAWDQYNVGDWRGAYAYDYAKDATDRGFVPVFTFYQMLQTISGDCLNCTSEAEDDLVTLNDPYAMRAYLEEFKLLMQLLGTGEYNGRKGIGKTAVVHVDPDLAGYAQQAVLDNRNCFGLCTGQGNDPALLKAAVASTRMPELEDLPDTYQGFNWALLRLRDLYAPNVIMAPHVNSWGTMRDVGKDPDPDLDVEGLGKLAGEFAAKSGTKLVPAGIKPYDFIFNDIDDDDSAAGRGYWLDRTNLTLPNFHRWEQFVKSAVNHSGKKAMIWQIPVGNQVYRAMNNTPGHYQDNKVEYLFGHMDELVDSGIVGLMFGHGQPGSTSHYNRMDDNGPEDSSPDYFNPEPITNSDGWGDGSLHTNDKMADYTDDDGGYLRIQAMQYYQNPIPVSNRFGD
ncbi:hypothetical protein H7B90_04585 [Cohnella xylanilytica]|uniref:Uncharacterized protein n=1 Tax=Cohnella xylanilytica TaxID=557555 RepID=A0A841TQV1_9BACL|nr:hypothetical protein [Cohnella xylanilytica]MBB6690676.1 hypothetical protein [Cohnella xylanilytica]